MKFIIEAQRRELFNPLCAGWAMFYPTADHISVRSSPAYTDASIMGRESHHTRPMGTEASRFGPVRERLKKAPLPSDRFIHQTRRGTFKGTGDTFSQLLHRAEGHGLISRELKRDLGHQQRAGEPVYHQLFIGLTHDRKQPF